MQGNRKHTIPVHDDQQEDLPTKTKVVPQLKLIFRGPSSSWGGKKDPFWKQNQHVNL